LPGNGSGELDRRHRRYRGGPQRPQARDSAAVQPLGSHRLLTSPVKEILDMLRIQPQPTAGRRTGAFLRAGSTFGALALLLGACESLMEVTNPNNVGQDDVEQPAAARALVNGSLTSVSGAVGRVLVAHGAMTDEFTWRGSFNHMNQLDMGIVRDGANQYTESAFNNLASSRWLTEETIMLLEGHEAAGNLADRRLLARANLYSGIAHATIPDMFVDFTFSNRQEPGLPIGEENMHTVYDLAVDRLDRAIAISQAAGDGETALAALALRARVKW